MNSIIDKNFKNVRIGDDIFTIKEKWTVVRSINPDSPYLINTASWSYTVKGNYLISDALPSAWTHNPFDTNDKPPIRLPDLEKDAHIWVRDNEIYEWVRRHFSHWRENRPACFQNGLSSFTALDESDMTTYWKYWKLPKDNE